MIHPELPGWDQDTEWVECVWCGAKLTYIEVHFTIGGQVFAQDDTITGYSSGHTGTTTEDSINGIVLLSGSWAGGDAAGWIYLYTPTGHNALTGLWGEAGELITGTSSGYANIDTEGGDPRAFLKKEGNLHRIDDCTKRDGKWYCHEHYDWYFRSKDRDESNRDARIDERDRGQEWS